MNYAPAGGIELIEGNHIEGNKTECSAFSRDWCAVLPVNGISENARLERSC
jgi:hypothetical protein